MLLRKAAWVLSLLVMAFIFYMSSRPIDVSRQDSARIMAMFGLVDQEEDALRIEDRAMFILHNAVRKYAHFIIYMGLGMLYFASVYGYAGNIAASGGAAALMTAVYGATDEFHQLFTGRGASVTDVLYDTAGGLTGAALMGGVFFLILNQKKLYYFFNRVYNFDTREVIKWKKLF